MFGINWCSAAVPGELILLAEHRAGPHHQAKGHPPGRVQSVHEGGTSHTHPGPSAGDSVRPASLQARGPCVVRDLRLRHAHPDELSGRTGLSRSRSLCWNL